MSLMNANWFWPAMAGVALLAGQLLIEGLLSRWSWGRGQRDAAHAGWRYLAALLGMLAVVAILLGGLAVGLWQAKDAGLAPPDWAALAAWLPGYIAGMALWLASLFYATWRRACGAHNVASPGIVPRVATLVRDESLLAILRASLALALGLYWGAWAAAGLRIATRLWFPAGAQAQRAGQRSPLLLAAALDVTTSVVVAVTGSAWVALATRLALAGVLQAAQALAERSGRRAAKPEAVAEA